VPLNPIEVVGGIAIGEGVGSAIGDVVEPQLRDLKNTQSAAHPKVPLPGELAARLIAQSRPHPGVDPGTDASYHGYSSPRFDAMIELARVYPTVSEALTMWRRWDAATGDYVATQTQVKGWLQYGGFSETITAQLMKLREERLDPAVVATGVQRSIFAPPPWLPTPDYSPFPPHAGALLSVPSFRATGIDADHEAYDSGLDDERLRVMTALVGLPLSLEQAASAYYRNIISRDAFARAVAEGNTRIEWGPAALEQARQILTANQYAELQLRGFITETRRRELTAQHGMSEFDSDHLFDILGRSVNVHQIVTGEARGGTYKPPPATLAEQSAGIPAAFLASLQRGNLRPEYYDLAFANRYTYPSFFAIRGLLTGEVLSADEGYQILLEMGWKPTLARKVADFYGVATTAVTTGPLTKSARTQAVTEIRSAFLIGQADEPQARSWLTAIGVVASEQDGILPIWNVMREVPQKGLTAAQIAKAYHNLPAAWPRQRALDELQLLGLTADDAATILDE